MSCESVFVRRMLITRSLRTTAIHKVENLNVAWDLLRCQGCARMTLGLMTLLLVSACDRGQMPRNADAKPIRPPEVHDSIVQDDSREHSGEVIAAAVPVADISQSIYRPDDRRIRHDEQRLAEVGIHVFESKRLKLYTDIDAEIARTLPPLIDELYLALEDYFGPLAPDRAGTDFQMSGFVMREMALFRGLGLIPDDLSFDHGAHLQNEFWMRDQEFDYYRRHLLIHEVTHCFMTFVPGVDAPRSYLEGMAEYFGAHRTNLTDEKSSATDLELRSSRNTQFCVMPTSRNDFTGFGRILIIRKDVAANRSREISAVLSLESAEFVSPDPYAWSWALCAFLDGTPRYRDRFRKLSLCTRGHQFRREFAKLFGPDERDLVTEWNLFLTNLQYGYDIQRAAIDFQVGESLTDGQPERIVKIVADRGWQSSGIRMTRGMLYDVAAEGRFTLTTGDEQTKPWESEPQGISFRYFDGQPLGRLLGCLRSEEVLMEGTDDSMLEVISIGSGQSFVAPVNGTLYLRLNDAWNSLHDNHGKVNVTIRSVPSPAP